MFAGRICVREVDLAEPRESVRAAAERMHQRKVGSLVVVDAHRHPRGVVTDRDLVTRVLAVNGDPNELVVEDVMSSPVATVLEETPVGGILHRMREVGCRRLVVVDERGGVSGVVSLDDVLRHFAEELDVVRMVVSSESPQSLARE